MKRILLLTSASLFLISASLTAQTNNVPPFKANTDSLKLVAQISQNQLKLGKLQNTVEQKTKNKQDAAQKSQQSADDNMTAASKLSNDPDDKKLAKNASNAAGDAKSDSRQARKESARLDALNKQILDLKTKIAMDQARLSAFTTPVMTTPAMAPVPVPVDTTTHL